MCLPSEYEKYKRLVLDGIHSLKLAFHINWKISTDCNSSRLITLFYCSLSTIDAYFILVHPCTSFLSRLGSSSSQRPIWLGLAHWPTWHLCSWSSFSWSFSQLEGTWRSWGFTWSMSKGAHHRQNPSTMPGPTVFQACASQVWCARCSSSQGSFMENHAWTTGRLQECSHS